MPVISTVITATGPQARTARSSGLLKLSLTELELLSRERVRMAALLAAAALLGAGLLVAAVAPTGRVARGIGALLFYPMMFFAGLWLPIPSMPAVLQHISHATPLGAAVPALTAAAEGSMPTALQLGTLAAWAVALGLTAARFFRWE